MSGLDFLAHLPFPADEFQRAAIAAIDAGESVVVAAPTGSGKTVIAEAAIHRAVHRGTRAFYTAPIKALSNQKFGDLRKVYGPDNVGLLTGDNVINPGAPVVVMTTEVVRNMTTPMPMRCTTSGPSFSTRFTTCRTRFAVPCGRKSSSICPST